MDTSAPRPKTRRAATQAPRLGTARPPSIAPVSVVAIELPPLPSSTGTSVARMHRVLAIARRVLDAARSEPRRLRRALALAPVASAFAAALAWGAMEHSRAVALDADAAVRAAADRSSAQELAAQLEREREARALAESTVTGTRQELARAGAEAVALRLRLGADQAQLARVQRQAGASQHEAAARAVDVARADRLTAELAAAAAQVAQGNAAARRLASELATVRGELEAFRNGAISILSDEPVPPPVPEPPPSLDDTQLAAALAYALEGVDGYADPGCDPDALAPTLVAIGRATCGGASAARRRLLDHAGERRREVQDALDVAGKKLADLERVLAPVAAQKAPGEELSAKLAKLRIELELTHRLTRIRRGQLERVRALELAVLTALARHAPGSLVERLDAILEQAKSRKAIADPAELATVARVVCEHRLHAAAPALLRLLEELALAKIKTPTWTRDFVRAALVSLARGQSEGVFPPSEKEASQ